MGSSANRCLIWPFPCVDSSHNLCLARVAWAAVCRVVRVLFCVRCTLSPQPLDCFNFRDHRNGRPVPIGQECFALEENSTTIAVTACNVTPLLILISEVETHTNSIWKKKRTKRMKLTVLATLFAAAAAFAPAKQAAKTSSSSLKAFEDELGAQPPLGFFDPLGLVADGDQEKFDRLRYTEVKHGRISMLAVVGYLVQEAGIRLPGDIDFHGTAFADIPNGFGALNTISGAGICQLVFLIGFLEVGVMKDITGGEHPGDFRNDFFDLGWDSFDAETQMTKRAIELNQGRAAMMGILALMVHERLGVSLIPEV